MYDKEFFTTNVIINCDIVAIIEPKRFKCSAKFTCEPISYIWHDNEIDLYSGDIILVDIRKIKN